MKYMSKIGVVLVGLLLATVGARGQTFIGEYEYSDGVIFEADVTVKKVGNNHMMIWELMDGGVVSQEMVKIKVAGETRLVQKAGSQFGEYFILYENGDLAVGSL